MKHELRRLAASFCTWPLDDCFTGVVHFRIASRRHPCTMSPPQFLECVMRWRRRGWPRGGWRRPELTVAQILRWADAYYEKFGDWPMSVSGRIPGTLGLTWRAVEMALVKGLRGFPGGS